MMPSRALHSREELLNVIRGRCPFTSCNRAIDTGEVVVLGGFTPIEGTAPSYWVVHITSRHNKSWYITVEPALTGFKVRYIEQVKWQEWAGDKQGEPSIYNGDRPMYFAGIKRAALERIEHDTASKTD